MPKKAPNNYTDNLSEDETPKGGDKKAGIEPIEETRRQLVER